MSGDYLSRDEMLEAIKDYKNNNKLGVLMRSVVDAFTEVVEGFPAAEVAPVVHGKWDKIKQCTVTLYKCSVCGGQQRAVSDYCPRCGARMDLKGE